MTQLQIKLHQPFAQGYIESGAMAIVRRLSDVNGNRVRPSWSQEKPVDIAGADGSAGEYSKFELPGGGNYGVDITLPRGADISREFLVNDDQIRTETITMEVSPHEYLGWQQYAGIVRSDPYRRERRRRSDAPRSTEFAWLDHLIEKGESRIEALYDKSSEVPKIFAVDLPTGLQWELMARPGRLIHPPLPGPPVYWEPRLDNEFVTWFPRMPDANEGMALINQLRSKDAPPDPLSGQFPRWLGFDADGKIDIASVPWPWWGGERNQDEEIRFLYDRIRPSAVNQAAPGHLTITLQDRRWFGLLEFLASGRLSRTGDMTDEVFRKEDPEQALYGKLKGPLTAVAGGIVLVARAESAEEQRWDSWLENLSNWFPGIPDGPILLGNRRIQRATNAAELRNAYDILRGAIERGIPFFSASIRMLALALAQISDEIPEADNLRRSIARVSTRVDPDQPFTVIRL